MEDNQGSSHDDEEAVGDRHAGDALRDGDRPDDPSTSVPPVRWRAG